MCYFKIGWAPVQRMEHLRDPVQDWARGRFTVAQNTTRRDRLVLARLNRPGRPPRRCRTEPLRFRRSHRHRNSYRSCRASCVRRLCRCDGLDDDFYPRTHGYAPACFAGVISKA